MVFYFTSVVMFPLAGDTNRNPYQHEKYPYYLAYRAIHFLAQPHGRDSGEQKGQRVTGGDRN